ncbi:MULTISPECIES: 3-oxo-tetronate kinase [Microbacterium]|uniref:3-oxo-tetronate kinase n=1 Tax=Microbacterium wangchenii TaxID=2541726 RepID=A0ABX5SQC5_9MICO|nr:MULTISPECIES: 3-oxo-tetronate kinase [Microbacterium]MCK6066506.1 four-carbon acid sugar kinase family protein [Microbacterium sp. EYE_512]QBR87462.1 four-carbon acid sugar kinase family protein [Microbacterium wangchenii]TFV84428.1 four-carbon acid sugar kinase family protein [Microbacterium sp. dk485]TXK14785.1 four-carbon acid sugar kinase family protein [Microbacterium wangchenii]
MSLQLGVVADDLTGACDVAAGVHALGVDAEVRLGVPDSGAAPEARVVIVALKSRTAPAAEAVRDSVASARVLRSWGARRLYLKYCSTFDSTDEGNIGPVADALLDLAGEDAAAVGTPATPAAARTMHRGHLFVGDRLLSESSLAHHPLTPMRDADLIRVLARQTPRPVAGIPLEILHAGPAAVAGRIAELRAQGVRHVLLDAVEDGDLDAAAAAAAGAPDLILTGAAGFAAALARSLGGAAAPSVEPPPDGARLILSGSGSERTRAQVSAYRGPSHPIDVSALVAEPTAVVAEVMRFVGRAAGTPLVTATAEPEEVARLQARWGRDRTAALVEDALARVAVAAVEECGVRRVLVAGGETSGAVAAALGATVLRVRRIAAPGVAWTTATDPSGRVLDLCFKSGNFGGTDFFDRAWD